MSSTNQNFLSIQAGLYGLSFLSSVNGVQLFHHIHQHFANPSDLEKQVEYGLREFVQNFDNIKQVKIFHDNELNTWIPVEHFNPRQTAIYLQYNFKLLETDAAAYDELPFLNAVNVYLPYVNLNNKLLDFFPSVEYYHTGSAFAEYAFKNLNRNVRHNVFVHFSGKLFRILIFDEIKMIFYNTFQNHGGDDFLYYFFFVWEQWNLNEKQTRIVLGGDPKAFQPAYQALQDFTQHVKPVPGMNHEILKSVI